MRRITIWHANRCTILFVSTNPSFILEARWVRTALGPSPETSANQRVCSIVAPVNARPSVGTVLHKYAQTPAWGALLIRCKKIKPHLNYKFIYANFDFFSLSPQYFHLPYKVIHKISVILLVGTEKGGQRHIFSEAGFFQRVRRKSQKKKKFGKVEISISSKFLNFLKFVFWWFHSFRRL